MPHSYQDFEPEFQYHKGKDHDVVEFQVKDFRKDQLTVHLSSKGILTVSGERPQEGNKRIRFRKDITPPKGFKPEEIRAKLSSGVLLITMPKKVMVPQGSSSANQDDGGKLKQEGSSSKEAMTSPKGNATLPKTALKVFAGAAGLALLVTLLFYVYKIYAPMIMND